MDFKANNKNGLIPISFDQIFKFTIRYILTITNISGYQLWEMMSVWIYNGEESLGGKKLEQKLL